MNFSAQISNRNWNLQDRWKLKTTALIIEGNGVVVKQWMKAACYQRRGGKSLVLSVCVDNYCLQKIEGLAEDLGFL